MICPVEHKHSDNSTCYIQHKCRCEKCRAGATERARRRRKLQAYGRWDSGLVDAAPVRDHIQRLQAYGMGWKRIAEVSGVGYTAVSQLIYGRKGSNKDPRKGEILKRITKDKAEKLLAVKLDVSNLRPGAVINSRGFHRRVEALMCNGWSKSKIAALLDIPVRNFQIMLRRNGVTVKYHLGMIKLFDQLWNVEAPHGSHRDLIAFNRSKNYAKRNRFVPALGWDDIDLDAAPVVSDEAVSRMDEVQFLFGQGMSGGYVADALALSGEALERWLWRNGRGDLAQRVHAEA